MMEQLKQVPVATWARSACLILAFINQAWAMFGKSALPILEDDLYQLVTLLATILVGAWNWWENNSFTKEALEADKVLEAAIAAKKAATSEENVG